MFYDYLMMIGLGSPPAYNFCMPCFLYYVSLLFYILSIITHLFPTFSHFKNERTMNIIWGEAASRWTKNIKLILCLAITAVNISNIHVFLLFRMITVIHGNDAKCNLSKDVMQILHVTVVEVFISLSLCIHILFKWVAIGLLESCLHSDQQTIGRIKFSTLIPSCIDTINCKADLAKP